MSGVGSRETGLDSFRLETGWSRVRALPRPISQVGWSAETTLSVCWHAVVLYAAASLLSLRLSLSLSCSLSPDYSPHISGCLGLSQAVNLKRVWLAQLSCLPVLQYCNKLLCINFYHLMTERDCSGEHNPHSPVVPAHGRPLTMKLTTHLSQPARQRKCPDRTYIDQNNHRLKSSASRAQILAVYESQILCTAATSGQLQLSPLCI